MKFFFKAITAIGGVAVIVGIDKWSNLLQSYFDSLYPHLSDYIIMALIGSVVAIGTYEVKTKQKEKQYNAKKLNDEIFRKLMRVVCLDYHSFFENKFGFCIPTNNAFFINKPISASIALEVIFDRIENVEKEFRTLEDAIPTLLIGEKYLQQNYVRVYEEWLTIKQELDSINKDRVKFLEEISQDILKELKKKFGSNPTPILIPYQDGWAYFSDHVPKIIPLLFKKRQFNFVTENPANTLFYVKYEGYPLVGFNKQNRLDFDYIKLTFSSIIQKYELEEKDRDFQHKLINLNSRIEIFCEQLEKTVVDEIDNINEISSNTR